MMNPGKPVRPQSIPFKNPTPPSAVRPTRNGLNTGWRLCCVGGVRPSVRQAGNAFHVSTICNGTATSTVSMAPIAAALSCFSTCRHVDFAR